MVFSYPNISLIRTPQGHQWARCEAGQKDWQTRTTLELQPRRVSVSPGILRLKQWRRFFSPTCCTWSILPVTNSPSGLAFYTQTHTHTHS